jgi:crotonobetainyl-CoA:carnitine CoA-transferase CaiB-like acyl-CoA transferase
VTDGLLEGVRVLDLGIWRPVPYATQLLAEMGADVLKVEPPGGDPMRVFPPLFAVLNAGKRSIMVDLKDDNGRKEVLAPRPMP